MGMPKPGTVTHQSLNMPKRGTVTTSACPMPDGFRATVHAYAEFLDHRGINAFTHNLLSDKAIYEDEEG